MYWISVIRIMKKKKKKKKKNDNNKHRATRIFTKEG
jgi:hypothetical protein